MLVQSLAVAMLEVGLGGVPNSGGFLSASGASGNAGTGSGAGTSGSGAERGCVSGALSLCCLVSLDAQTLYALWPKRLQIRPSGQSDASRHFNRHSPSAQAVLYIHSLGDLHLEPSGFLISHFLPLLQ